jgi:hypothetical protein
VKPLQVVLAGVRIKQLRDEGQSAFRHSGNGLEEQSLWFHVRTRKWRKILCMLDVTDLHS